YEIGTRNATTLLRLKDGETQILAGLIQESDTRTANTIPGLGDIPILSHLFGTHHSDHEKDEIVLSITPRIIRMQPRPSSDATEFWYGTETRTRSAPYSATAGSSGAEQPTSNPQPAAPNSGTAVTAPPPASSTTYPGAEQSGATTSGATTSGAAQADAALKGASAAQGTLPINAPPAAVASNAPAAAGASGGNSALTLDGPSDAQVGQEFQVTVRLATDQSITRLRAQLRFDSSALQLMSATPGDLVPAAARTPKVEPRGSGAQLDVNTTSDEPVQGSGSLMVLQFKALQPRAASDIVAMLNVLGGAGAAVDNSTSPPLKLAISAAR